MIVSKCEICGGKVEEREVSEEVRVVDFGLNRKSLSIQKINFIRRE